MKTQNILLITFLFFATQNFLFSQAAQRSKQTPLQYLGAQIGNEISTTTNGCYIGTAGTIVTDGTYDYILSNSHVLAREGQGSVGENIMHTVSTFCDTGALHVAELAAHVPLKFGGRKKVNYADAAVARITPNVTLAKDNIGRILHIGNDFNDAYGVSPSIVSPSLGLVVKKSGRTTGLTTSAISYIGVNVTVTYDSGRATFYGQFVVSGSGFSAGGDSGSLIATDDANSNPVGLLFAGSSTDTTGNPINLVVSELETIMNKTLTFGSSGDIGTFELVDQGGNNGGNGKPKNGNGNGRPFSGTAIEFAKNVRDQNLSVLHEKKDVLGSGIGLNSDGSLNITLFLKKDNPGLEKQFPSHIEGISLKFKVTGEFVSY